MIGLSTAPVGMNPKPQGIVCENLTPVNACPTTNRRTRLHRAVRVDMVVVREQDYPVYMGGDAVTVENNMCDNTYETNCADMAYSNARYILFIHEGNVYARIANGRRGQRFTISLSVTTSSGAEHHLNYTATIEG